MRAVISTSSVTRAHSSESARTAAAMRSAPSPSSGSRALEPPTTTGATNRRISSTSPASRKAPARCGPPSSRIEVTPSAPSWTSALRTRSGSLAPVATRISAPATSRASVAVRGAARETTTVRGTSGAPATSWESSGRRASEAKTIRRGRRHTPAGRAGRRGSWGRAGPTPARLGVEAGRAGPRAPAVGGGGERRPVGQRGPEADGHGVAARPPAVRETAGVLAGDPLRVARAGGDLAVQRHGGLEQHERAAGAGVLAERLIEQPRLRGELAVGQRDLDALVA